MMKLIGWNESKKQQNEHEQTSSQEQAGGKKAENIYNSQIGKDCISSGDMELAAGIKVMGTVMGSITVREGANNNVIIVHADAVIEGDLKAELILVAGRVIGNITGHEVKLYSGCFVEGEVTYGTISVQDGVRLNGYIKYEGKLVPDDELVVTTATREVDGAHDANDVQEATEAVA